MIELPGKLVGKVSVLMTGGSTVMDEYSIVEFVEGSVDSSKLSNYVIQDK